MMRRCAVGSKRFNRRTRAVGWMLALGVAASLSACSAESPAGQTSPGPTESVQPVPAPTPTATSAVAQLVPDGTAADNLPYFDHINDLVLSTDSEAGGRAFIDALAGGGFDRDDMEVTRDETPTGLAADSIQFAVLFDGKCLIGQTGPSSDGYHSMIAAPLGTADCLVGDSRPIDW